MKSNDRETLFLRYKDQIVSIKTISGGIYEGRLLEVTDDYVTLIERETTEPARVFLFLGLPGNLWVKRWTTGKLSQGNQKKNRDKMTL